MKFLFRLIPATHSDATPKSGRLHVGIGGRFASEWVAGFRRNARPESSGICTYLIQVRKVDLFADIIIVVQNVILRIVLTKS